MNESVRDHTLVSFDEERNELSIRRGKGAELTLLADAQPDREKILLATTDGKERFVAREGETFEFQGRKFRVVDFKPEDSVTLLDINALKRVTLPVLVPR